MIRKKRKKKIFGKILSFKLSIFFSIIIIALLSIEIGREYYLEHQIQKEINSLQKEIDHFEKNNYKLSLLAEYYKTEEYKELEARKRLNMKKDGENVVIIRQLDSDFDGALADQDDRNKNIPNYVKWWNYFFATKQAEE